MLDKAKLFLKKIQLKNRQRALNKEFARQGLTDEILEKQVAINKEGHKLNLPDEDKFVYEEFVQ